jgi:hypothetical protein
MAWTLGESQAQAIRSAFLRNYSGLRQWHGESRNAAESGIAGAHSPWAQAACAGKCK